MLLFSKDKRGMKSSRVKKLSDQKADENGAFTAFWEDPPSVKRSSTLQAKRRPPSNGSSCDPHLTDGGVAMRSGSSRLPSSSLASRSEASSRWSAHSRNTKGGSSPMMSAAGGVDPQLLLPPAALLSRNQRSAASLGSDSIGHIGSNDSSSRCLIGPRLASARSVNLLLGAFNAGRPRARQLKPLAVAFPAAAGNEEDEASNSPYGGLPPAAGSRNVASVPHLQTGKEWMERHTSGRRSDPDGCSVPRAARWQREVGMNPTHAHGSVYLNSPGGRIKAIQVKEAVSSCATTQRTSSTFDGQGGWVTAD